MCVRSCACACVFCASLVSQIILFALPFSLLHPVTGTPTAAHPDLLLPLSCARDELLSLSLSRRTTSDRQASRLPLFLLSLLRV